MTGDSYKKHFTIEEQNEMKASEVRKLRENEQALMVVVGLLLVGVFFLFITLVALFLWTNKLTIFLSIIIGVPTLLLYVIGQKGVKTYKRLVKEIKDRINSQEKHTI